MLYNITHMAKAYEQADLETIMKEAATVSARLSNLHDYLTRQDGTIGAYIVEKADELDKLARACELALDVKDGYEIVRLSSGEVVSTCFYEQEARRYCRLGYSFIEATGIVASDHSLTEEDCVAIFGY